MTTSEVIINYANLHNGSFSRKELMQELAGRENGISEQTLSLQLNRLVSSCQLCRTGRGLYSLPTDRLPELLYEPSVWECNIYGKLKDKYPFLDFCIWSPRVLSSFMLHIPNIGYTFVDVEKDGMESVFLTLQQIVTDRNILFAPSSEDCDRYLTGSNAVVIRQLIGQSPLTMVNNCQVPRIEKIMVDAIGDNELLFASGSEIYNIFESAFERNQVNRSKLLRYASRRNRKNQVEQIICTIEQDDKSGK
ncbi:MAG: hypothetical protein MJZ16_11920 [Bacteroidales bacterium]|nr:hypothetical protein [Bacteroidales bacterium]